MLTSTKNPLPNGAEPTPPQNQPVKATSESQVNTNQTTPDNPAPTAPNEIKMQTNPTAEIKTDQNISVEAPQAQSTMITTPNSTFATAPQNPTNPPQPILNQTPQPANSNLAAMAGTVSPEEPRKSKKPLFIVLSLAFIVLWAGFWAFFFGLIKT